MTGRAPRGLDARRAVAVLGLGTALVAAILAGAPLVGAPLVHDEGGVRPLSLARALDGRRPLADNPDAQIYLYARLPRVLAAAVAGAALATTGCAFQALLRNPLADPYTLGVSGGGSLGAVLAIRLGLDRWLGPMATPLAALLGALATIAAVYQLARSSRMLSPSALLLGGVTLSLLCSALILLVQYTADFAQSYRIVRWLMGGLDWLRWDLVARAAVPALGGVVLLVRSARALDALAAGPDAAASVGVDVGATLRTVYVASSVMVAAVVSVVGPIGFVGLIVPHALRGLVGPDHRLLLPASALGGAALLVACDALARTALAPAELPVGVVTALLGAPCFLALLVRGRPGP